MTKQQALYFKVLIGVSLLLLLLVCVGVFLPYWKPHWVVQYSPSDRHALYAYLVGPQRQLTEHDEKSNIVINDFLEFDNSNLLYYIYPRFNRFSDPQQLSFIADYLKDQNTDTETRFRIISLLNYINQFKGSALDPAEDCDLFTSSYDALIIAQIKLCDRKTTEAVGEYLSFSEGRHIDFIIRELNRTADSDYFDHLLKSIYHFFIIENDLLLRNVPLIVNIITRCDEQQKYNILHNLHRQESIAVPIELVPLFTDLVNHQIVKQSSSKISHTTLLEIIKAGKWVKGDFRAAFITTQEDGKYTKMLLGTSRRYFSSVDHPINTLKLGLELYSSPQGRQDLLQAALTSQSPAYLLEEVADSLWEEYPEMLSSGLRQRLIDACLHSTHKSERLVGIKALKRQPQHISMHQINLLCRMLQTESDHITREYMYVIFGLIEHPRRKLSYN